MRSPVSVVIANLVREDVEERALTTFHYPSTLLEEMCGRQLHGPSQGTCWPFPEPPQWNWAVHQFPSGKNGRSWMCSYAGKMMAQWVLLSTASRHTPTSICPTTSPTILQHTRPLLSGHWWPGQSSCDPWVWSKQKRRSMWWCLVILLPVSLESCYLTCFNTECSSRGPWRIKGPFKDALSWIRLCNANRDGRTPLHRWQPPFTPVRKYWFPCDLWFGLSKYFQIICTPKEILSIL